MFDLINTPILLTTTTSTITKAGSTYRERMTIDIERVKEANFQTSPRTFSLISFRYAYI